MGSLPVSAPVETETYLTIQSLLYAEARLLDSEQYEDWLDMLTDDLHYYMPMPVRYARDEKKNPSRAMEANIFNDHKEHLKLRVARFRTGLVWAENPQNHLRHLVSNIEVFPTDTDGEWQVLSVVTVHRNRIDGEERRMIVSRTDTWRLEDDKLKLAKRDMVFNHAVIPDTNLNIFF
jgi:3-phenylpropionate/trans-cinnamate dioxygenase beta subunit